MSTIKCPRCKRNSFESPNGDGTGRCLYLQCSYTRREMEECNKAMKARPYSQKIGEFMDWLFENKQVVLAGYHHHTEDCINKAMRDSPYHPFEQNEHVCGFMSGQLEPLRFSMEKLLMEFFNIDSKKLEEEKLEIIEAMQKGES